MLSRILAAVIYITAASAVWPQPSEIRAGAQILWLDPALKTTLQCNDTDGSLLYIYPPNDFRVSRLLESLWDYGQAVLKKLQFPFFEESYHGESPFSECSILRGAVRETLHAVHDSRFIPWKLHKRGSAFEPDEASPRQYLSTLQIRQRACPRPGTFYPREFFGADESYELTVDASGSAVIQSNSTIGSIRGLQSFQQLFYAHSNMRGAYTPLVPTKIVDQPRWTHRGLSIDIARNHFDPRDLIRTIDAMAITKLNRMHIHATDSQSWPLEIPALPALAQKGAYQPQLVWSASRLEEVQVYGASKGVSVFVEIDMPGHTASVAHAYPNLVAAFNELDWSTFAAEPLSGQLKLNSTEVKHFVGTLLDDLLPRTNRYTSLYHMGGDELNKAAYLLDETVHSENPQILQPLLQEFVDRVVEATIRHGLQPIVWEEMVLDWNLTLPSRFESRNSAQTLVQVWRNSERIEEVLKRGHKVVFGDFHHWYLDCGYGQFLDPYPSGQSPPGVPFNTSGGDPSKLKKPFLDYCNPHHNWRHIYTYDPLVNVSEDLQSGIEGGEVLLWSEQTDSNDLDSKLWPRVAAAAEVLWAGVRDESMLEDATRRLGEWRERAVVDLGIRMSPVQMTWCLMEGGCNL